MEITPVNLFPIGIRFSPTEVELVDYYLANKVMNKPFQDPTNRFQELELYNYTPKKLQEKYGVQKEHEMYIFVKRVLKHQKGKRLQRRITDGSNGFWKASTGEVKIELDGVLVGHRRTLVYYKGEGEKTNWLMYEYRLPDHYFVQLGDWLLCKVYLNEKKETILNSNNVDVGQEAASAGAFVGRPPDTSSFSASQWTGEQFTAMITSESDINLPDWDKITICWDDSTT
ncbi:NAC domain-containing protein 29 [Morus notabilis]|uniref:NAC domain-containing protein 29 n=1 Tax=Morus notabilis TaxID=981085 RepID=W9QUB4_9ROSA|nr:NAC domain-containing protein 29 [Morus notabilis]